MRTEPIIGLLVIATLLSIEISAAINASDNNISVGNPVDLSRLMPYIPVLLVVFAALSFFIGPGIIRDKIPFLRPKVKDIEGDACRGEYYRREMINQVRNIWIKGFLANSLHSIVALDLGLDECQDKIDLRGNLVVQPPDGVPRQLPPSSKIIEVFDELGKSFLILGEPGSGKTILLLQLARGLLDRADGNDKHPIPVVFQLSTWAAREPPLAEWLVDELTLRYGVSRDLGEKWVHEDNILPLLDGLDEVAKEHREACVEGINKFREQHGLLPLVVCSHRDEYDALGIRLKLPSAVIIKPLATPQIGQYLKSIGTPMEGVQVALQDDEVLRELLETPLMLNIVTLAFKDRPPEYVRGTGTPEERRKQIFDVYRDSMFDRPLRSPVKKYNYNRQQTEHWLSWLAKSMKKHNLSIFYPKQIQPDWLPLMGMKTIKLVGGLVGMYIGFMIAFLVGLLVLWAVDWLVGMLVIGVFFWLLGLAFGAMTFNWFKELGGEGNFELRKSIRCLKLVVLERLIGALIGGIFGFLLLSELAGEIFSLLFGLLIGWIFSSRSILRVLTYEQIGALVGVLVGVPVGAVVGWLVGGGPEGRQVGGIFGFLFGPLVGEMLFSQFKEQGEEVLRGIRSLTYEHVDFFIGALASGVVGSLLGTVLGVTVGGRFGPEGENAGAMVGGIFGLLFGLQIGEFSSQSISRCLTYGHVNCLIGGLIGWMFGWLVGWQVGETLGGVIGGVLGGIIGWLASSLIGGLVVGLISGLVIGLIGETVGPVGLIFGLIGGLLGGLIVELDVGVMDSVMNCIRHYLLRITLRIYNLTPLNYVKFLDHAADRIFLRKVGGGYVFIHRMIMDYFASLEPDNSVA